MVTLPDYLMPQEKPLRLVHTATADTSQDEIADLLYSINPDCGYDEWLAALMALHAATGGSQSGFALADDWSARGSKYAGTKEIEGKWRSFKSGGITSKSLAHLAREHGANLSEIAKQHYKPENTIRQDERKAEAPAKPINLPEISASTFAGKTVPVRRFHDEKGLIPHHGVTLIYGDGGTGKSLIALQLAAATVTGKQWLGLNVRRGPVYMFSCEDTIEENHIRLAAIADHSNANLSEMKALKIAPMAGHECVMAAPDKSGIMQPMPLFTAFIDRVKAIKPALIIIDNAIDVYAGDQNNAAQVKQFMHLLHGASLKADCPIVLLAHPSKSGMSSGSGDAGSVHWSNSSRSRLYLSRVLYEGNDGKPVEDDPNARTLARMKANYAATGDLIKMHWEAGCFVHDDLNEVKAGDEIGAASKAERVFMHLLRTHYERGQHVSPSRSSTYAPSVFARHPQAEGVSKRRFEIAMETLFTNEKIELGEHGKGQSVRKHIKIVSAE